MIFKWNADKNKKLIKERNISFDEIRDSILENGYLYAKKHKNEEYKHQVCLFVLVDNYVYQAPCIILQDNPKIIYLITAFKDRKANKKYYGDIKNEK